MTHKINGLNVDISTTQKASGGVAVVELFRCRQKVEFAENQREGERPWRRPENRSTAIERAENPVDAHGGE